MNDPIHKRIELIREFYSEKELDGIMNWIILNGTDAFDEWIFQQVNEDQKEFKAEEEISENDLMDLSTIGTKIDRDAGRMIRVRVANEIHRMRIAEK